MTFSDYYALLGTFLRTFSPGLNDLADQVNIPLVSVLIFGLIGAMSPCQLTTNLTALAWVSRGGTDQVAVARASLAYLLGKAMVYTLVGSAAILIGTQLQQAAIPIIVASRRAMGPLLIVAALVMLGVFRLNVSFGQRLSGWLETRARGARSSFLLGVALSLAFCPTLFWLFFGLTLPLAVASAGGFAFPAVFAAGTTLPLLLLSTLIAGGVGSVGAMLRSARRLDVWVARAAAIVFLLAGINETVLYWVL
ncbi:MAG: sulfite exporter TauE/SafE family protein [Chloroflexi bacterium]|nr:sulfite exporter TauE/SafE family protein [Chloroflexota bacterium]